MMTRRRSLLLAGVAGAASLAAPFAHAEAEHHPNRPVRLVLPFSPGGTTDIMARMLSARFQAETGQPLVVENKPGAGGMIATELVQHAAPDGHTLLLGSSAQLAVNPALYANVRYDALRDFAPVCLLGATPNVFLSHPGTPIRSLQEMIAAAKASPGKLAFASPGTGSTAHLAGELLEQQAQIQLVHVPYKGAGPAVTDALGGQVPLLFVAIPSIVQHVQAGRLRALAVTGRKRSPALPDVPAVAELITGFDAVGWYGVLAPAGTPQGIVRTLSRLFATLTAEGEIVKAWGAQGIEMLEGGPDEFAAYLRSEIPKWAQVIRKAGLHAQ
jgi:tripartite-type tricarboxylate transporter receptor subunit TctC